MTVGFITVNCVYLRHRLYVAVWILGVDRTIKVLNSYESHILMWWEAFGVHPKYDTLRTIIPHLND